MRGILVRMACKYCWLRFLDSGLDLSEDRILSVVSGPRNQQCRTRRLIDRGGVFAACRAQQRRQLAGELDRVAVALRGDADLVDEAAQRLGSGGARAGLGERGMEVSDLLSVDLRGVGVDDDWGRGWCRGLPHEFVLARLENGKLALQRR